MADLRRKIYSLLDMTVCFLLGGVVGVAACVVLHSALFG